MIIGTAAPEVLGKETIVGILSPLICSLLLPQPLGMCKSITFALLKQGWGDCADSESSTSSGSLPFSPSDVIPLPPECSFHSICTFITALPCRTTRCITVSYSLIVNTVVCPPDLHHRGQCIHSPRFWGCCLLKAHR